MVQQNILAKDGSESLGKGGFQWESQRNLGLLIFVMKYHFLAKKKYRSEHSKIHRCDHPVYNQCTLYLDGVKGLAVIQQRYKPVSKMTWWSEVDPALADAIFEHPKFKEYLEKHARISVMGIYPTVTVRQLMWALRMKPLKKDYWETVFDRKEI